MDGDSEKARHQASTLASVGRPGYFADPAGAPPLPDLQINLVCAAHSLEDMRRVSRRDTAKS